MIGANKLANWGAELGSGGAATGEVGAASGATGGATLALAVTVEGTLALATPRGLRGTGAGLITTGAGEAAKGAWLARLTVMARARTAGPVEEEGDGIGFASRWTAITPAITPCAASDAAIATGSALRKRGGAGCPATTRAARAN